MKKLNAQQQLLIITMEECGELIHACSKALRRGELYENSDSQLKLKQEVGDVYAMLDLLVEWDILSWNDIEDQRNKKRQKLKQWSDLI
jgi:NTP pyrophosphatase (non-canonical NTP hydrolase)|tara:strand:- start:3706 stop:3969 length:264 start_codon:yes stop_codon:yes gene_type:complete